MNLTAHFTLEEATFSETASRLNIPNQPSAQQLKNMQQTAVYFEKIRVGLDAPIKVNSWLRLPAVNVAIGGSLTSAHMDGWAIDSTCNKYSSPYEYSKAMLHFITINLIPFDQIIHEYGSWVHVSFDPKGRKQLLTIFHNDQGKKYLPGLLTKEEYLA